MAFRGGLGPVFAFEWLIAARRWQGYAWRAAFVGLLLAGLVFVRISHAHKAELRTFQDQAEMGRTFYQTLVLIELVMVLLAAPAATAGAICQDKARGTLFHVLVTDLSDVEIVLGKLAARLVPVLGLVACSLPVLALGTLLGGIDPVSLTGSFLVILGVGVLGCALALTLSVWGKKTHEVLLTTYFLWVVWILALPACWALGYWSSVPRWFFTLNPFDLTLNAYSPSRSLSPDFGDQLAFLAGTLLISAALVAVAVIRLRPVIVGQWGRAERARPARWRPRPRLGPALDGNPVLWREWHRRRPTRWTRIVWGLYIVLAVGFSVAGTQQIGRGEMASVINGFQAAIGLMLLSVSSATSLSEERARGSLDVLLATPLPTATIVRGKWWGTYRTVPLLAILPGLVAAAMVCRSGRWIGPPLIVGLVLAYGAAVTSLGLALATWESRSSRVLAFSVGAVVAVTIGAPAVAFALFPRGEFGQSIAMASPFWGVGLFSSVIEHRSPTHMWPRILASALFWIAAYTATAGVLLAATLATFDRCLGRISDRSSRPTLNPSARSLRKPVPVLVDEC